ncbi:MAG: lipid-A-disaccharide synthase [Pseudomonadota bacterium]
MGFPVAPTHRSAGPLSLGMLAGEASGDLLGAGLLGALAAQGHAPRAVGVGGPAMRQAGLESLVPMDRFAINGFVEPVRRLPELWRLLGALERDVLSQRLDAFVGIDFNVFNLLLERRLKRAGMPTAHYVSPSVYAWRRGRIERLAQSADLLLCLYPFEPPLYSGSPVRAVYVGHPLADEIAPVRDRQPAAREARAALGVPPGHECIAILPGSRSSEISAMLPLFLEAARRLQVAVKPVTFVLPCPRPALLAPVRQALAAYADLHCIVDEAPARQALTAASAAFVKSGTSTLEAMLLRCPMVVSYRLGALSYQVVKRLLRTEFIALPNILAGRALVPELLQDDATPARLASALLVELDRSARDSEYQQACARLHDELRCDANSRAAQAIAELVEHRAP